LLAAAEAAGDLIAITTVAAAVAEDRLFVVT
jgi:hypothetical protein